MILMLSMGVIAVKRPIMVSRLLLGLRGEVAYGAVTWGIAQYEVVAAFPSEGHGWRLCQLRKRGVSLCRVGARLAH